MNHNIRLLGRRGVMRVTLVCEPEELHEVLVTTRGLLRLPAPAEEGVRSCCPRCLAEFTLTAGECSDCALPLVSLRRE